MRILVINPNTSLEMTSTVRVTANKYASPRTNVIVVNSQEGPECIANPYDIVIQVPRTMDIIRRNQADYDYFIIACAADPGVDACRGITPNVIGIGEAAIMSACAVAKRFSFIYEIEGGEVRLRERLRRFGIEPTRCASVKVLGSGGNHDIVARRHEMFDVYLRAGRECVERDGAGAIILCCAGMSDLKEPLEKQLGVPIFSGVESAIKFAEQVYVKSKAAT